MPTAVPYKYYKQTVNGKDSYFAQAGEMTPQAGIQSVDYNAFLTGIKNTPGVEGYKTQYDYYQAKEPNALNQNASTGYIINPNTGNLQMESSYNQEQSLANDPNMMNVGTATAPLYVPKGSPATAPLTIQGQQDYLKTAQGQAYLASNPDIKPVVSTASSGGLRKLGPTEYANLVAEWRKAGLTNKQIEENYLSRQGSDIYLKTYAPSTESILNMTADSFGGQKKIDLPTVSGGTTAASSTAAGATATSKIIDDYIKQFTPTETETSKQYDATMAKINELLGESVNKATDQLTEEQKQNLPKLRQDLAEVNGQIKIKTAEYEDLKQEQEGKPITMASIIGAQAQIEKKKASEIGLLQAKALGLMGQVEQAQATANRAIDLKYSTIETNLKIYETQLQMLEGKLTKEENIYKMAQQAMIDDQKQAIADAKDKEKTEMSLSLDGYTKIKSPSQLAGLTENDIVRMPNGDIWKKPPVVAIKSSGGGSGGGGLSYSSGSNISNQTQAIIDNPTLFDDLTPTQRGKVISELQANGYDTANLGQKGLSDTAIKEISQTAKALSDLDVLKTTIQNNLQYIGPISGLQKYNPWSKARQVQADIDRVKQTVGKALEGGVLRKEDEDKYKKILATITDTPETALYKIDAIISSINQDIANYKSLQQASGRVANVNTSLQKKGTSNATPSAEDLRKKYNY